MKKPVLQSPREIQTGLKTTKTTAHSNVPNFADAYLGLGVSLLTEKKYTGAVPPLEMAVKLQPGNPAGHYSLATAYARTGRKEDAERELALQKEIEEHSGGQGGQNPR